MLIQVIYASLATLEFRETEIPALLASARAANRACGLTGMLLYIGGAFFQVLEGEAEVVDALYARILRDRRHLRVTQIIREPIIDREFSEWTMGFSTATPLEAGALLGENDFFNTGHCVSRLDAGRAKTLLSGLSKKRWELAQSGMHRALGRAR